MIGRSFGSVLDACAHNYPRETALVQGEVRLSYTEMFGRIRQTGRALQKLGLGPGDRLAFVMADSPALLEVMYGALWAGITTVPLNARLSLEDHKYMIEDAQARALVFDSTTAERGHELLAGCTIELAIATDEAAVPERPRQIPSASASSSTRAAPPAFRRGCSTATAPSCHPSTRPPSSSMYAPVRSARTSRRSPTAAWSTCSRSGPAEAPT